MYRMRGEFLKFRLSAFSASNIYSHDLSKVSLLKSLIVLAYIMHMRWKINAKADKRTIQYFEF